jgi:sporulation protein YlmC with PRC-barrel domain
MITRISTITLTLIFAGAPLLMAADTLTESAKYTDSGSQKPTNALKTGDEPKRMSRYMNGREVFNEDGKQIGTISDFVLDPSATSVAYLVLCVEDSDKHFAIPWAAFERKSDQSEKLYLLKAGDTLKNNPGFSKEQWPDTASKALFQSQIDVSHGKMIGSLSSDVTKPVDITPNPANLTVKTGPATKGMLWSRRGSAVIDAKVVNKQNEEIGVIKDIVFNPRNGYIHYAVLSTGGFLGQGNKLFAVPLRALNTTTEKTFILDVSQNTINETPSFDKDAWPYWGDQALTNEKLDNVYGGKQPAPPAPAPSSNTTPTATNTPSK